MSQYQIWTDSTTDFPADMIAALGVHVLPLSIHLEGQDYKDGHGEGTLPPKDFYAMQREGKMSTTSQINTETFRTCFQSVLDAGMDVLYLGFSSGLSGTYNSGRLAAEELREEYPDRKIITVDTLCASMGEGLLVYHAVNMQKAGKTIDEVAAWATENRTKLAHWFTVDDLNHLKRGGRVSGAAAFFGTMLHIKPVLHVDNEGHLIPMEKVRGRKASLDALVEHMQKTAVNPAEQVVFISHGDCLQDAEYVAQRVREVLGVKDVVIHYVGPVIGSHSGAGTVALFYLATGRD